MSSPVGDSGKGFGWLKEEKPMLITKTIDITDYDVEIEVDDIIHDLDTDDAHLVAKAKAAA